MSQSEKFAQFRDWYSGRKELPQDVTSERRILLDNLENMGELVEPETIPRRLQGEPVVVQSDQMERELGRFRIHSVDRKCITADMDFIRFYVNELGVEPPSFVEAGPRRELFHNPANASVAVLTSGGIAPGLNTVVEAIVERHCDVYASGGSVLGFFDGLIGLSEDRSRPLYPFGDDGVKGWCRFGGSRLGVGRTKPDLDAWLTVLRRHRIDILYLIGGNGSLTAAHEIAKAARSRKLNLSVAVIPKTMDNDVLWVWQSFGFVSAVEKAAEIVNILHTEAESNRRVCVIQLFGAKSGHVAANATLASGEVDAVLIPEEPFELDKLCDHVVRRVAFNRHAVVVMAEAATAMYQKQGKWYRWRAETPDQREANFQRLRDSLTASLKAQSLGRHAVFGNRPQHTIRSIAPNSHDQVYCRRLADMAVDGCLGGYTDFMISSWLTEYVLVPLVFSARNGLSPEGYKTFPTGGIFWKTVLRCTGQGHLLSDEAKSALSAGEVVLD